jgi:DNA invertase Pin-like site-specific DNA recombinase
MRLLDVVDHGDVVIVTRLDRLARSSLDLLHTIDRLTKAGASFRSLAELWCDTTTPHGKLILTVLAGMAEFERSLIMARTQAGIERARALGVIFGRRAKLNPRQRRMIAERYAKGETMAALADLSGNYLACRCGLNKRLNSRRSIGPAAASGLEAAGRRGGAILFRAAVRYLKRIERRS